MSHVTEYLEAVRQQLALIADREAESICRAAALLAGQIEQGPQHL